MTEQFAITARNEVARIPEERHHGMSARRHLPIVATETLDAKDDFCDLLLGCAVAMSIKSAKHFALTRTLLPGQPHIRGDGAPVKHGEQSEHRLYPVKTFQAQRYGGGDWTLSPRLGGEKKLNALRGIIAPQEAVATVVCSEDVLKTGSRLAFK